ncbi:uncharacterized protein HaLaN_01270 [Haematococcus lacustris]|uniref:Uncharacterized protein n=1 Tax=Haematococcus lacustris TaxID=44745 RepID=A0A699Y8V8_HAELA|nr:uncharacterized protein HaLaN_01270 [Haematococcus lacustris]
MASIASKKQMACRPLAASRRPLATKALFQSRTNVKTTKQAAAAPKPKKEEEAVVETRDSMMSQVVQALDFSQPRSRKDADLLWETKQNWKKGESKMDREAYKALRRKIGGTYKDYFKEYVEEERVENTHCPLPPTVGGGAAGHAGHHGLCGQLYELVSGHSALGPGWTGCAVLCWSAQADINI